MTIFERATKQKLRFESVRGELTVEQIWDLKLSSRDEFNLDNMIKGINKKLREEEEESFVEPVYNENKTKLQLSFDILKHVIDYKIKAKDRVEKAAVNAAQKAKLTQILLDKQDKGLTELSEEELKKAIEELG